MPSPVLWKLARSPAGEYLATLNVVDISTAWCVCIVPRNRGQEAVRMALAEVRDRLPMPLLGIDSDNDAAFIVGASCHQAGRTGSQ